MKVITCPEAVPENVDNMDVYCFLGGGISHCPNWQIKVINTLKEIEHVSNLDNLVICNPRNTIFPIDQKFNPPVTEKTSDLVQIRWERKFLSRMDIFSMYFCSKVSQSMCLFELGRYVPELLRTFGDLLPQRFVLNIEEDYIYKDAVIGNLALDLTSTYDPTKFDTYMGVSLYQELTYKYDGNNGYYDIPTTTRHALDIAKAYHNIIDKYKSDLHFKMENGSK